MPPPLHTLKILGAGVYSPQSYGAEFIFLFVFLFVCPSCYDARHRKPRRCVYALNLGGTGISPPDKSHRQTNKQVRGQKTPPDKSTPRQKSPQPKVPLAKSAPGQKTPGEKAPPPPPTPGHPTSGDIFYCSGSRQLNHSSFNL